ncbi:ParB/RepB/Spo0J family partition protein [Corynebacterium sp.]|uniref:ParB/RepB/Spo0J family partition protein n=1 Tax=Corynebacterium sp. TaxID=1720 RepID=UPI003B3B5E9A
MSDKSKPALLQLPQTETQRGGLGRGLAALIPTSPSKPRLGAGAADVILGPAGQRHSDVTPAGVREGATPDSQADTDIGATYRELPLGAIQRNRKNPRETFDEEPLNELVHSIKEFGLLQPVVVRPIGASTYELIMGERRLRASKVAGLDVIPAIVRETDDQDMLRDALLENIHRVQLNPLEEANAYQQLLEEFDVTQAELARRLGRSRPLITNMIRLLQLPVGAQRKVAAGVLSAGHARALLGVKAGAEAQDRLADRIIAEGLSVRATEEAVVLLNRGDEQPARAARTPREQPEAVSRWATSAADALDTRVTVQMGAKKGKIVVEFGDEDDFERITDLLKLPRD